jgi:hypothetical protein
VANHDPVLVDDVAVLVHEYAVLVHEYAVLVHEYAVLVHEYAVLVHEYAVLVHAYPVVENEYPELADGYPVLVRPPGDRHGATLDDVVKCTVFLADMRDWPAFNQVYRQVFTRRFPARSALGASGLALGARVEVECLSYLPRARYR